MDIKRDDMISKLRGTGDSPSLVDGKFLKNLQNPQKIQPPPPKQTITEKVDKFVLSKSYRLKNKLIKNIKTKKSFLFNLILLILFIMVFGGWLFYKWYTRNPYNNIPGINDEQYARA